LEKKWAFLGRKFGLGIKRKSNSFGEKKELDCNKASSMFMVLATGHTKIAIVKQLLS